LAELSPEVHWPKVHTMEMPPIGVSSTEVRRRVREGLPIDYLVPPDVVGYIREHGLYQGDEVA
ncbi:MAG: nicotinate-nicotinamide nucleotide adenylyltransferase, partial [Actinomycetota bacterium]